MFQNMLMRVFTTEEFTADEAQVDEEDEFADEYAFHDDCLLSGVQEIITTNIQVTHDLLKQKLERVRKSLERKEREKDGDIERRTHFGTKLDLFSRRKS